MNSNPATQATPATVSDVLGSVLRERQRQDEKWGEQNHTPIEWLAVLTEEVGEVAQAAINLRFHADDTRWIWAYQQELIHVAAVAVAAIESLDRNEITALLPSQHPACDPTDAGSGDVAEEGQDA